LIREKFSRIDGNNEEEIVEETKEQLFNVLKQTVRPEFLNRIDDVVMFRPLSRGDIRQIVELQLHEVTEQLAEQDILLTVAPEAMDWLAAEGYNPEFGARPLKRVIKKRVLRQLSKQMLAGDIQPGSQLVLDVFDDVVVFRKARENERVAETV